MISLEKQDALKFYNCQFWAPSYLILAKTLSSDMGITERGISTCKYEVNIINNRRTGARAIMQPSEDQSQPSANGMHRF